MLKQGLQKADLARQRINVGAQKRAGAAASNILGSVVDLGANAALALVTKSPWAIAGTLAAGAALAANLFSGDNE